MAQRHSSSFLFDALLWTLSECRMMLLQKYCSQKKPMITKVPDIPHRNKPQKRTVGRKIFLTPLMNHWDRYVPKAELIHIIPRVLYSETLYFEGKNDIYLLPTTESTTLQQHCHCLVCDDSFIPTGKKCHFLQSTPYSPQTPCHELHWTTALNFPTFQLSSCPAMLMGAQIMR